MMSYPRCCARSRCVTGRPVLVSVVSAIGVVAGTVAVPDTVGSSAGGKPCERL